MSRWLMKNCLRLRSASELFKQPKAGLSSRSKCITMDAMSLLHHLFIPHESNNQRAKLLHPSTISVIIGLFVIFQLLLGRFSVQFPQILGYASQISPAEIVRLTNEQRQASGEGPVKLDEALSAAAARKAADMIARGYWAHVSPSGTQPWSFITDAGYQYRYAGENLARDFADPASVVAAWMDSPTHRENLLNAKYQDIGVAVIDGKLGDRETTLVVQMFGTRLSAAPSVSKTASIAPPVRAATIETLPTPVAKTSPFDITKAVSVGLLAVFVIVLVIDIVSVHRRRIVRWTSKSLAHLALLVFLLIAAILVNRGVIL